MICNSCQRNIADGSRFCYNCGAKQPETPSVGQVAYAAPRRLVRSRTDKKIAGVCSGLADYFELDPTVIRLVWVLLFLLGGTGLLAYIILWIVLPVAPAQIPVSTAAVMNS